MCAVRRRQRVSQARAEAERRRQAHQQAADNILTVQGDVDNGNYYYYQQGNGAMNGGGPGGGPDLSHMSAQERMDYELARQLQRELNMAQHQHIIVDFGNGTGGGTGYISLSGPRPTNYFVPGAARRPPPAVELSPQDVRLADSTAVPGAMPAMVLDYSGNGATGGGAQQLQQPQRYNLSAENNAFYGTVLPDDELPGRRGKNGGGEDDESAFGYGSAVYLPRPPTPPGKNGANANNNNNNDNNNGTGNYYYSSSVAVASPANNSNPNSGPILSGNPVATPTNIGANGSSPGSPQRGAGAFSTANSNPSSPMTKAHRPSGGSPGK